MREENASTTDPATDPGGSYESYEALTLEAIKTAHAVMAAAAHSQGPGLLLLSLAATTNRTLLLLGLIADKLEIPPERWNPIADELGIPRPGGSPIQRVG